MERFEVRVGKNTALLTEKQLNTFNALMLGDRKFAAEILGVSVSTVDFHITNPDGLLPSFGASSIDQLRSHLILQDPNYREECRKRGNAITRLQDLIELTDAQFEVANFLFTGLPYPDIGEALWISTRTVNFHIYDVKKEIFPNDDVGTDRFDCLCALINYGFPFIDGESLGDSVGIVNPALARFSKLPASRVLQRMRCPDPLDKLEP